jgi:regulator of sigma E protease
MHQILHILYAYLLPFIYVLGLLVFIHELGHFLLAKLVRIRVERFSLGFPPRLFGKKLGETDYCISAVPFGGYVKMSGMIDESMDSNAIKGEPWEFMSKPMWMRFLVILAGPVFNILLTVVIFAASIMITGIAVPGRPIIERVVPGMPAAEIGLQPGDVITSVDSQPITVWEDLVKIIHNSAGQQIQIEWERNGVKNSRIVIPELDKAQNVGLIGIEPVTTNRSAGFFEAIAMGCKSTWNFTRMIGRSFYVLFSGQASFSESLAGPVKIAQMAGETAKSGFGSLMIFAAFLSLNLGLLNLLPFPVLDGGHLAMLTVEAIIRRPISVKLKLVIQQIGMAILLVLMLFVIVNDFSKMLK